MGSSGPRKAEKVPGDSEVAQLLLAQEGLGLGGPRHGQLWEGGRKWLRGASWNLREGGGECDSPISPEGWGWRVWRGELGIGGYSCAVLPETQSHICSHQDLFSDHDNR